MEYANAFLGKSVHSTNTELAAALGPPARLWYEFIQWMADKEGVTGQEWKGVVVKKYGWSLRFKQKSRNFVYLGPGVGCFMAGFVLSDKALKKAKEAYLPKAVRDVLAAAPRYPEGNGLCLVVHRDSDLPTIRKIAAIKLAN